MLLPGEDSLEKEKVEGGTLVLRGTLVVHAVQYGHSIEQAG